MGAERVFPGGSVDVEAAFRLEPLPLLVEEGDEGDREVSSEVVDRPLEGSWVEGMKKATYPPTRETKSTLVPGDGPGGEYAA